MTSQQLNTLSTLRAIRLRNLATAEGMREAIERGERTIQILSREPAAAWHEGAVNPRRDQHED